jgi:hypothetical protein
MQAPGGREGFDNLPATRGPFVGYGNTPRSGQIDTVTPRIRKVQPDCGILGVN